MSTRPSVLRWVQQVLSVEKEFSIEHYYADFVRIVRDVTENGGAL